MGIMLGIVYLSLCTLLGVQLLRIAPLRLQRSEILLAGTALGVCALSFATMLISMLTHNLHYAIIISVLIISAALALTQHRNKTQTLRAQFITSEKDDRTSIITLCIISAIVLVFLAFCYYTPTTQGYLITARSWGDNLFHASIAESFAKADNFPPTYPNYAGAPLTYYFMADFISAILLREGFGLYLSFLLPQALLMITFFFLIFTISRRIGGTKAAAFIIAITLFSTSIGIFHMAQDLAEATGTQEQSRILFHTTYGLDFDRGLLKMGMIELMASQRPLAAGLAMGAIITLLLLFATHTKTSAILTGIIIGIMPWFHIHAFLFLMLCIALYTIFNERKIGAVMLISAGLTSLPRVLGILKGTGNGFLTIHLGWMAQPFTLQNALLFWAINWGILIAILAVSYRHITREHRFLYFSAIICIILINIIQLQPSDWDNHKLLDSALSLALPLSAGMLRTHFLSSKKRRVVRIMGWTLLAVLCITGVHSLLVAFNERYIIISTEQEMIGNWADATLPRDARVLTIADNNPISMVAGRSIYIGYAGQLWSHGFVDYTQRIENIDALKKSKTREDFCATWKKAGLSHAYIGERETEAGYPAQLMRDEGWGIAETTIQGKRNELFAPQCP